MYLAFKDASNSKAFLNDLLIDHSFYQLIYFHFNWYIVQMSKYFLTKASTSFFSRDMQNLQVN